MKFLFFLTGVALLMASVAGCVATDDAPSTAPTKAVDFHPQADASLPEGHAASKFHCSKTVISTKSPWLGKINANLMCAAAKAETGGVSFVDMAARMGIVTVRTGIVLDIMMNRLDPAVLRKLEMPGVTIRFASETYRRVSAVISNPALLFQLAKIPEVRAIIPEYGGRTRRTVNLKEREK